MLLSPLKLRRFDADKSGSEMDYQDTEGESMLADLVLLETGLTAEQLKNAILATDMDSTMFKDDPENDIIGDLGILVFIEKLADPNFWRFDPIRFEKLLFPEVYKKCALEHLSGSGSLGIEPATCDRVLNLARDIAELYALQKKMVKIARERRSNGDNVNVDINTPVVNEFALKMIEFDQLIKNVEQPLIAQGRAKMLMRTRFFSGTNVGAARQIARKIMKRSSNGNGSKNSHVNLSVHEESLDAASELEMPYDQRIADIEPKNFRRVLAVNENVRKLIARLNIEHNIDAAVVTANLAEVAEEAVAHSSYRHIIDKVIGSHLKQNGRTYSANFDGAALHGQLKADVLREIFRSTGRKLLVAIGDSDTGDLPMGLEAISNGGIFVATGADFEAVCRKFQNGIRAAVAAGIKNVAERTWVSSYG